MELVKKGRWISIDCFIIVAGTELLVDDLLTFRRKTYFLTSSGQTSVNSKFLLDASGKYPLIFLILTWLLNVEIVSFIFLVLEHL